jgi:hypothetical protein
MLSNFDYYRKTKKGKKILVRRGLKIDSRSENLSRINGALAGILGGTIAYEALSKPNRISKSAVGLGLGSAVVLGSGAYKLHRFLERRAKRSRN